MQKVYNKTIDSTPNFALFLLLVFKKVSPLGNDMDGVDDSNEVP